MSLAVKLHEEMILNLALLFMFVAVVESYKCTSPLPRNCEHQLPIFFTKNNDVYYIFLRIGGQFLSAGRIDSESDIPTIWINCSQICNACGRLQTRGYTTSSKMHDMHDINLAILKFYDA